MRISDWSSDVCSSDLMLHLTSFVAIVRPTCHYRAPKFFYSLSYNGPRVLVVFSVKKVELSRPNKQAPHRSHARQDTRRHLAQAVQPADRQKTERATRRERVCQSV